VGPRPTFIPLAPGPHRLHPNAGAALGTPPLPHGRRRPSPTGGYLPGPPGLFVPASAARLSRKYWI
jgi:hypothetical protein